MVKKYLKTVFLFIFLFNYLCIIGQTNQPYLLSNDSEQFIKSYQSLEKSSQTTLRISNTETLAIKFNVKENQEQNSTLIGSIINDPASTISLRKIDGQLKGSIIMPITKRAFTIYTEGQKVFINDVDINDLICTDYDNTIPESTESSKSGTNKIPLLESFPGGEGIIYLDFDGEVVVGTDWNGGARINAQSPNFSDEKITNIWRIMAEDFRPFRFNVTTNRALFDAAPVNKRMMCIFTPTDDAAPGSGGVAWVNSFSAGGDFGKNPCWAFNSGTRSAGETGSHEVGHTLGLGHDGTPSTDYYAGHGNWSPIMGWGVSRSPSQWSKGEYPNASNQQDDIAIISGSQNGIGYKSDDHNNDILNATPLSTNANGDVLASKNFGLIERRNDIDVFAFNIEAGNVQLNINPNPNYPNLNIAAKILNGVGTEVAASDLSGLNAVFNLDLPEGDYFLEIDGVGSGNLTTGYSDYASLGNYTISGKYILGDNSQPPIANFKASTSCGTVQFQDASTNKVTTYLWDFGDNTTSTLQNPTHTYTSNGNYTVSLKTVNSSGESTEIKSNFITIDIPGQPMASNQTVCENQSVQIESSGSKQYRWYDAPNGGNLIHTGPTLSLTAVTANKTYYIEGFSSNCKTSTRTPVEVIIAPAPDEPVIAILNEKLLSVNPNESNYEWYFNDIPIEGANESTYLPNEVGEYKVIVSNATGCSTSSKTYAVDLSQLNLSQDTYIFKYYPNPTKSILTIEGLTYREKKLSLVNVLGQTVFEGIPKFEMDFSTLSNGTYFIIINETSVGKIIKE